jgi:hypothetical protein
LDFVVWICLFVSPINFIPRTLIDYWLLLFIILFLWKYTHIWSLKPHLRTTGNGTSSAACWWAIPASSCSTWSGSSPTRSRQWSLQPCTSSGFVSARSTRPRYSTTLLLRLLLLVNPDHHLPLAFKVFARWPLNAGLQSGWSLFRDSQSL